MIQQVEMKSTRYYVICQKREKFNQNPNQNCNTKTLMAVEQ